MIVRWKTPAKLIRLSMMALGAIALAISPSFAQSPEVAIGAELVLSVPQSSVAGLSTELGAASLVARSTNLMVASLDEVEGASISSASPFERAVSACRVVEAKHSGTICEPNVVFRSTAIPNDSYWPWLGNLRRIDAPRAWETTASATDVLVAVVDTGVDYGHPDLYHNIAVNQLEIPGNGIDDDGNGYVDDVFGYDFADRSSDPMDLNGHGTHVAGIIGARGNDGRGVVGVAWRASILPIKVLGADGSGTLAQVVAGVDYAVVRGARVINLSLGAPYGSKLLLASLQRADTSGAVIVVAAGNESVNNDKLPSFPANYELPSLISVAATTETDELASFSNYGRASVHIAAPGESILSTYPSNYYVFLSGTSMAAPHVAGAAALMLFVNPALTGAEVRGKLLGTVDMLPSLSGVTISGGRLNVARAVEGAISDAPSEETDQPGMGAIAVDLKVRNPKLGSQSIMRTEAYSLASGETVSGVRLVLVCGRNTVVGRGKTNRAGKVTFRIKRDWKTEYCAANARFQGKSYWSNSVTLRALRGARVLP